MTDDPLVRAYRRRTQTRAVCTECGLDVATHKPRGGDGTAHLTFWHKNPVARLWCRSVVDLEAVRIVDRPAGWGTP